MCESVSVQTEALKFSGGGNQILYLCKSTDTTVWKYSTTSKSAVLKPLLRYKNLSINTFQSRIKIESTHAEMFFSMFLLMTYLPVLKCYIVGVYYCRCRGVGVHSDCNPAVQLNLKASYCIWLDQIICFENSSSVKCFL